MSWIAQLTGHATAGGDNDPAAAEADLARKLQDVARDLVALGHEGIAATFTGDHAGTVNLLAPPADTPDTGADAIGGATPQPPAAGETQPANSAVPDGTPAPLPTPAQSSDAGNASQGATPGYATPPTQS